MKLSANPGACDFDVLEERFPSLGQGLGGPFDRGQRTPDAPRFPLRRGQPSSYLSGSLFRCGNQHGPDFRRLAFFLEFLEEISAPLNQSRVPRNRLDEASDPG